MLDLASRTGVFWGEGARQAGWVGHGEAIKIGPFSIRHLVEGADQLGEEVPTSRSFRPGRVADVTLDLPGPELARDSWRASRVLVLLGRSVACRVLLPGPGVAPFHAAIVRTPGGAWVIDLLGPGGIAVNGSMVRSAQLGDGYDELQVGPHRIGIRCDETPPGAGAELMRTLPSFGQGGSEPQISEPLLGYLMEEFGRTQDRMADQFQQALMTMFRLFSGMHQDQMALIRDELARLHELTEEQRSLQSRLTAPPDPRERPPLRLVAPQVAPARPHRRHEGRGDGPVRDRSEVRWPIPTLFSCKDLRPFATSREGRWQKLINSVLGRGNDRAAP